MKAENYKHAMFLQFVEEYGVEAAERMIELKEKIDRGEIDKDGNPILEEEEELENKKHKWGILNTVKDAAEFEKYARFVKENTKYVELFPIPVLPGKLNLIIAPSGNGKTTYLNNMAVAIAETKARVLYITSEQENLEIGNYIKRIEKNTSDYPGVDVLYLEAMTEDKLGKAMAELSSLEYDYVFYDYIKFSTLVTSQEPYIAITRITDMFNRNMVVNSNNTVFFAAIQSNTKGQEVKSTDNVAINWPMFLDGGGGAGRHAANIVWIQKDKNNNSDITICKTRDTGQELIGKKFHLNYNAADGRLTLDRRVF